MKNKALAIGLILISLTQTQINTAKAQSWEEYEGKWYYKQDDGEYAKNTWIDGYYFNQEGEMQTNTWTPDGYYVGEDGKWEENIKTGWNKNQNGKWTYIDPETKSIIKNSWIGNYYVGENGNMQTNAWTPGGYYVDENGEWEANKQTGWQQEGNNYYYIKENGEKITNEIIEIGGSLFCFDENGKMKEEEWIKIPNNKWAYAKEGGYLAREEWIGNYYLGKNGITLKNTWTPDGYYVGESGEWEANKKQGWNTTTEGKYYYIDAKGDKVKNGIKEIEGNLFYFDEEGTLLENQWKKIDQTHWIYAKEGGYLARNEWLGSYYVGENGVTLTNTWSKDGYYLGETGEIQYPEWKQNETGYWYKNEDGSYPKSEWKEIAEKWYHFDENGYMQTGWQYINNKWYYLTDSGAMAKDTWIGGIYYLDSNGAMLTNTWTPDGYYVDENGVYDPDKAKEEGWYQINGNYYYGENGRIVKNSWVGNYYLGEDGQMLTNTTTPDGYYVDENGCWEITINTFQYKNLKSTSNYTSSELDEMISMMGGDSGKLAGKGATFKAAEERYGVNALYLLAHAGLESAWGKSQIAILKNNFFGIAAYDNTPFQSAYSFDGVDAGILGAAKFINNTYLENEGFPARGAFLGDKTRGMNVYYATDPNWGYKIAKIMFNLNERMGRKDY